MKTSRHFFESLYSSDPYHKIPPVNNLEASNDFPDSLAWDLLGNKGDDMEGAMVGPGRDRNTDGMR